MHPNKNHKLVSNVVSHIISNYTEHGRLKLPNTDGGRAFRAALRRKGVKMPIVLGVPMKRNASLPLKEAA